MAITVSVAAPSTPWARKPKSMSVKDEFFTWPGCLRLISAQRHLILMMPGLSLVCRYCLRPNLNGVSASARAIYLVALACFFPAVNGTQRSRGKTSIGGAGAGVRSFSITSWTRTNLGV